MQKLNLTTFILLYILYTTSLGTIRCFFSFKALPKTMQSYRQAVSNPTSRLSSSASPFTPSFSPSPSSSSTTSPSSSSSSAAKTGFRNNTKIVRESRNSLDDILQSVTVNTQLIVVLVGLPGSGKSTAALKIANGSRKWTIVCQDVLGTRNKVLEGALAALERGDSVIIDRCNFDKVQRKHWTNLAEEFQFKKLCQEQDRKVDNTAYFTGNSAPIKPISNRLKAESNSDNEYFDRDSKNDSNSYSNTDIRQIVTVCVVMPNGGDIKFCSQRAFSRGNDGIHERDTDWEIVCKRMKKDYSLPSVEGEAFADVHICSDEKDLNDILQLLSSAGHTLSNS